MTKQKKIDTATAKPIVDNGIEEHLLEQVVGGRGRGYSTVQRNRFNEAAAEAATEEAQPVYYGKFGAPVEATPEPTPAPTPAPTPVPAPTPEPDVTATVASVMADLPDTEPTYVAPTSPEEEEKPDYELSTSFEAEADGIKSVYTTGIAGVWNADSSGAAVGFGLSAQIMTEMELGGGATLTNTTEASIGAGAEIMIENGLGAEVAAEISVTVAWEIARQTELGNGVTMDNSAGVEGFLGAAAEGEAYVGEEGGKWGFDAKAGADYTAETSGTIDASQVAMTGEASISSSGSIGGAFSQEATYKDGALTLGLSGDVDAVIAGGGLGGSVSIQFEDKYGTVGSPAEIAAVQSQLQHFDSAADLDNALTNTWHNDLKNDVTTMRQEQEWAEHRIEQHAEVLEKFDEAVSTTIDDLATREADLKDTAATIEAQETAIRAHFPDDAAFEQAMADIRAFESGRINDVVKDNAFGDVGRVVDGVAKAADGSEVRDTVFAVVESGEPPVFLDRPTEEANARIEALRQENPDLFDDMRSFAVMDAKQDAEEARLDRDKDIFHAVMQSDGVQEFVAEEKAVIDGYILHMQTAGAIADSLEAKFEAVKDMSYSAAVVTADKMVAIADANVNDASAELVAAQERLAVAQTNVDNSPYVGKSSSPVVSAEDAKALEDAKADVTAATANVTQAMVDQRAIYAQATALHPEKSMAATEEMAGNLHQKAEEVRANFEAQFVGVEMTKVEQAQLRAYQHAEHLMDKFSAITKDDGALLAKEAEAFGEKTEVLKAQLALLTAMELKERGVIGYAEEYFNEATGVLGEGVTTMARAGEVTIEAIGDAATTAGNAVADGVTTGANAVADGVTTGANAVADGVTTGANAVGDAAEDTWNSVTSWF